MTEMASLLDQSDFNETTFKGFLGKIDQITDKFQKIDHQQIAIQCGTIVDSRKCFTLLVDLSIEFRGIMDEKGYRNFKKNHYIGKVKAIETEARSCEAQLLNR